MPPNSELQPENSTEQIEKPHFEKAVFGHWFHEFDRDQFFTYYFALKAGLVNELTEVDFTPTVTQEDLINEEVIVIEGVPENKLGSVTAGNYDNDPDTDAPAASVFYEKNNGKFGDTGSAMMEINRWIKKAEAGIEPKKPKPLKLLTEADLQLFSTKIFHGLKLQYQDDPTSFLQRAVEAMDALVADAMISAPHDLKTLYKEEIDMSEAEKSRMRNVLKDVIKSPERSRTAETATGITLAYLDTRDLDVTLGGTGAAVAAAQEEGLVADLVVLISDTVNDSVEKVGTKVLIKIPKGQESNLAEVDLRTLLKGRLNQVESLFGHGYDTDFGGHAGVIGSSREKGSGIDPKELWVSLQTFFEVPRYTQEDFHEKVREVAEDMFDTKIYNPNIIESGQNAFHLPERVAEFIVDGRIIKLSESELPLYESYFVSMLDRNITAFDSLMKGKTDISEPVEISNYRATNASISLHEQLKEPDTSVIQILNTLNDLNPGQITGLPRTILIGILEKISTDPDAIDAIWNKDNLRYAITTQALPDWMPVGSEQYKDARFKSLSLSYKIDKHLLEALIDEVIADPTILEDAGLKIFSILTSQSYTDSHQGAASDQLLSSYIKMCTDTNVLRENYPTAVTLLESLTSIEAARIVPHLKALTRSRPYIFNRAIDNDREHEGGGRIESLLTSLSILRTQDLYDLRLQSESEVILATNQAVSESIERQRSEGKDPIVSVLAEIGRPVEDTIAAGGILRVGERLPERNIELVSVLKVKGLLQLGPESNEVQDITHTLYQQLTETLALAQGADGASKIRLIMGGFPGPLTTSFLAYITERVIDPETSAQAVQLHQALIYTHFSQQDRQYNDMIK